MQGWLSTRPLTHAYEYLHLSKDDQASKGELPSNARVVWNKAATSASSLALSIVGDNKDEQLGDDFALFSPNLDTYME